MENSRLVALISKSFATAKQLSEQSRGINILQSRRFAVEVIDGSDLSKRNRRNELFRVSGLRGQYPQFFLEDSRGHQLYIGGFEAVEDINEASSLPEEVLQDYPEILTWDKLLNEDLDFQ